MRLLLLIISFSISLKSNAQQIRWTFSDTSQLLNPSHVFVKSDKKVQILSAHKENRQCYTSLYDEYLNNLAQNNLQFDKKQNLEMVAAIETRSLRSFFLLSEWQKKEKRYQFYLLEFNEMGKVTGELTELFTIEGSKKSTLNFYINYSEDKSKIAIVVNKIESKNIWTSLDFDSYIAIYDGDMDLLYKKRIQMPEMASKVHFMNHWVADNGLMLYYYKLDKTSSSSMTSEKNHLNKFIIIDQKGNTLNEMGIEEPEAFFTDFKIYPRNNSFSVGGFFSTMASMNSVRGVATFSISFLDGKIQNKKYTFFDQAFYDRVYHSSLSEDKKNTFLASNYKIIDFYETDEGKMIWVAEQFWTNVFTENRMQVGFYGTVPVEYYYQYNWGNLLTFSISEDQKILWTDIYYKRQIFESRREISSYDFYHRNVFAGAVPVSIYTKKAGDQLNIVFNDSKINFEHQMAEEKSNTKLVPMTSYYDLDAYLYQINLKNGDEVIEPLIDKSKLDGIVIFPRISKRVDSERLLLYGKKKYKDVIGLIKF